MTNKKGRNFQLFTILTEKMGMTEIRKWLEDSKRIGMSLGLENTHKALTKLSLDLSNTTIIHVAGSNGKGTTCAMISVALTIAGHDNILFSSPHLCRVEERIRLNGVPISDDKFDDAINQVRDICDQLSITLTFFEITYICSKIIASQNNVEYLILETGLGGRLDATRCSKADVCLLTSITKEHSDILGQDIYQIIAEKAAIARPNKPLIVRRMHYEEFTQTVEKIAYNCGQEHLGESSGIAQCKYVAINDETSVLGEAEILASAVLTELKLGQDAIKMAKEVLNWPGRLQLINVDSQLFLLDSGHNPSGLSRVKPQLCEMIQRYSANGKWNLLFATSPQNDLAQMMEIVNDIIQQENCETIVLTKPLGGRYPGVEPSKLENMISQSNNIISTDSPSEALEYLLSKSSDINGLIVSFGSLYLQGNILTHLGLDSDENLSLIAKPSKITTDTEG